MNPKGSKPVKKHRCSLKLAMGWHEVPLREVFKVHIEPLIENADVGMEVDDHDYTLEEGGGLISNTDTETAFTKSVNNVMVDATPHGHGLWKKRKNVLYSPNWWTDNSNYDSDS